MLAPVRLTELDAGDFGDGIGLVGRLQAPCQQRVLGNRLGSFAWIDARRAEEQKLFDARAVGGVDDVSFDEQVVVEKVRGEGIVGAQSPHAPGREKNDLRTLRGHPVFDLGLASQIDACAAGIAEQSARFALESAHHGAAHHAVLTGDPGAFIAQIEDHRRTPISTATASALACGARSSL